jgi:hypothetical protein
MPKSTWRDSVKDEVPCPYKTTGKTVLLHIITTEHKKTEDSGQNGSKHYRNSGSFKFPSELNTYSFPNIKTVYIFKQTVCNFYAIISAYIFISKPNSLLTYIKVSVFSLQHLCHRPKILIINIRQKLLYPL